MERIEETPLVQAARELKRRLAGLQAPGRASYLYNPLEYAFSNHAEYLVRFGKPPKQVIFLGMNPGPFGMAQTGIPFGDVRTVADWLRIDHPVGKPEREHPKRPIRGLGCSRVEVSGQRLWGAIRAHFGTPERFFQRFFVANYCPLCFVEDSGRNCTPDKLPAADRDPLFEACDAHLRSVVAHLRAEIVVGIGGFAEKRAAAALRGMDVRVARILHPSPASPAANRGWGEQAQQQLSQIIGPCGGFATE